MIFYFLKILCFFPKQKIYNEIIEFLALKKKPVDGFHVSVDEKNILNWEILIFGPIDTH